MLGLSMQVKRGERGFSLVEIVVVCAIVAVLSAIAIPAAINQRAKANEASMRQDLYSVSTGVETALSGWRGVPPTKTPLQWNSATKTWSVLSNGSSGATVVSGIAQNTIAGTIWTNGSYCIKATDSTNTSYFYNSSTKAISTTDCLTADVALGGNGTIPGSTAAAVPGQPTNLTATNPSDNTVNVSWSAVAGATSYSISVTGVSPGSTASTTYSATSVPPGSVTVAVRAVNANGSGQAASTTLTVTGTSIAASGGTGNGGVMYYTPTGSARTVIRGSLVTSMNPTGGLGFALANNTSAQALFPTVNGNASGGQNVSVSANTTYDVDCSVFISGMAASSRSASVAFVPTTATLTSWGLTSTAALAAFGTPTAPVMNANAAGSSTPTIVLNSATVASTAMWATVKGQVRTNAAGTLQPQITFGTAGPGNTTTYVASGSNCYFTPLGSDTMTGNP